MSKPNKARIQTSGTQDPLNNPFASALANLGPLPEGPAEVTPRSEKTLAKRGRVLLRREKAHRGGKAVIVLHDFSDAISDAELEELARNLKKSLGVGGAMRGREVEIQGDHAPAIRKALEAQGFRVGGVS